MAEARERLEAARALLERQLLGAAVVAERFVAAVRDLLADIDRGD